VQKRLKLPGFRWLAANAEGQSSRPPLPEDLLAALSQRYIQLYEALSAEAFVH